MKFLMCSFVFLCASAQAAEPIRIQLGGEPSTLDPARIVDQYGIGIVRNVVEGLFRLDGDGNLQNGLVDTYSVSKDGLKYRFKLRADAKWSDGKPVTIEDCILGLRHTLDPKTAGPSADYFFSIKNAREVYESKKPQESLGVTRDKDELVIELGRKDPSLPFELTLPTAAPVRADVLAANKGGWSYKDPVTGDYIISVYKPSELIELTPNPAKPKDGRQTIVYRIFPEEMTAMNLFDAGKLDVISTITLTEVDRYRKQGTLQAVPSTTVYYFSFNNEKAPFNDVDWRKAVSASIDREGLAKVFQGSYEPVTSYLPKSIDGALPTTALEAKASMAKVKAAIEKMPKRPRYTLAFGASAFTKMVAEKVQNDLQQKLGLVLNLEPMELKTLLARLKSDPPDMHFLGMSAVYNDPLNQLKAFSASTTPNFSRYKSPEFEKLLSEVQTLSPGPARAEKAKEANRLLVERDVALAPALLRLQTFAVSKKITGFKVSPYQVIDLKSLRKP